MTGAWIGGIATIGIAGFITFGVRGCNADPPQPIEKKYTYVETVHHSDCMMTDGKSGMCIARNNYVTYENRYVFVSRAGSTCMVDVHSYNNVERGQMWKCKQLFGWSN